MEGVWLGEKGGRQFEMDRVHREEERESVCMT